MPVGTCSTMCPAKEIQRRKYSKVTNVFETNDSLFVKEYCRSAAGKIVLPEDIRTWQALEKTVKYLLENVLDVCSHKQSWITTTNYITDRLRAVRQDIIIQQLQWQQAVPILEKIIRYHIFISYALHSYELRDFDPVLNNNLIKTYLSNLFEYYDAALLQKQLKLLTNFAEFHSYYMLLHIKDSSSITKELSVLQSLNMLDKDELSISFSLAKSYHIRNFYKFFRITQNLYFLQRCCIFQNYVDISLQFLSILNTAFSSKHFMFPLQKLQDWLMLDDRSSVNNFLTLFGLEIKGDQLCFDKTVKPIDLSLTTYTQTLQRLTFMNLVESAEDSCLSPVDIISK